MIGWYALLALAAVSNAAANALMKAGMQHTPEEFGILPMVKHYLTSWPIIVGVVLFGLNVLAYTQALAKLSLSVAYPIMVSLTGLVVISVSVFFFKETISWIQWLGFALIIGGVICVAK